MITISLCMIVKNEEKVLKRCLDSVKDIVDEIIIVDTGSKDNTKEIAKKFTSKVLDFKWVDDFSKARNYSFSKATKDYILWLDADDIILKKDRLNFLKLKKSLSNNVDVVMMKYNVGFDENGNTNFAYYRERLLKRSSNFKWESPIHEVIQPSGNIIYSNIAITHKKENHTSSIRNLKIFENMISNKTPLSSRQKYYYARELMYNNMYLEAIEKFNEFLEDKDGWIENKINACLDLSYCYFLLNDNYNELLSLLRSFLHSTPRAEILCSIGNYFLRNSNYEIAIYWYKQAIKIKPNLKSGAFCNLDYYKFIPYLNLCLCYYMLGDIETSKKYNEKAGKIKPKSEKYLYNKNFFDSILN